MKQRSTGSSALMNSETSTSSSCPWTRAGTRYDGMRASARSCSAASSTQRLDSVCVPINRQKADAKASPPTALDGCRYKASICGYARGLSLVRSVDLCLAEPFLAVALAEPISHDDVDALQRRVENDLRLPALELTHHVRDLLLERNLALSIFRAFSEHE